MVKCDKCELTTVWREFDTDEGRKLLCISCVYVLAQSAQNCIAWEDFAV